MLEGEDGNTVPSELSLPSWDGDDMTSSCPNDDHILISERRDYNESLKIVHDVFWQDLTWGDRNCKQE